MHNYFSLSYGHEKKFTKSEDYFYNGSMFREDWNKDILKIQKLFVSLLLRFLSKFALKSFISNEMQS